MRILNQLSVRTGDYMAAVYIFDNKLLSYLFKSVKGLACVGNVNKTESMQGTKVVQGTHSLYSDVFDKIISNYDPRLDIRELVRVADDFGLVLLLNVPIDKIIGVVSFLNNRTGIFDTWTFKNRSSDTVNLLFKVRKYRKYE